MRAEARTPRMNRDWRADFSRHEPMQKAAYMAIIFTLGLWTGGIFAPTQTPAREDEAMLATPPAHAAPHQESDERVKP